MDAMKDKRKEVDVDEFPDGAIKVVTPRSEFGWCSPWVVEKRDRWIMVESMTGTVACDVSSVMYANLIAAAPSMYDALRGIVDEFTFTSGTRDGCVSKRALGIAIEALRKAHGA